MTNVLIGQVAETADHYRRKAEAGDTDAMYNFGVLLEGRDQRSEAAKWYRLAAQTGDVDAMFNLAGVLQDLGEIAEAQEWYRRAADAGDVDARRNLELLQGRARHPSSTPAGQQPTSSQRGNGRVASTEHSTVAEQAHPTGSNVAPVSAAHPPPPPGDHGTASQWGQPSTPTKSKRPGRILRRVIIAWNVLAVIWLIGGIVNAVVQSHSAASNCSADLQQTCQSAYNVGALIGVGVVVFFWVAGDVILGVLYLVRGRGDRR